MKMLKQFSEVFWQKAKEYVAEQGLNNALNIKDFDDTLEDLQNNLKLLSAKAVDVETEIKNAEDSGRKKRKREADLWLEGVRSTRLKVEELGKDAESKGFMMRFLDRGKAAQLNADIDKLVQQRLHIGEPVFNDRGSRGEVLPTNEMVGEAYSQKFETILEVLENGQVSRIGVYGMGGVGKTTLVKHIYNRLVQEYEGRVVWVTVSHEFTIKSLQEKIAQFMGVELEEEAEEAFRATSLKSFLSNKKISVLILDDVWRHIDMSEVGCDLGGCRLIITTRSLRVCRQIGCQKEIPVEKLQEGEAWKLFNERLGNEKLDHEVEGIAKSMVKLCGGLPLGIITMARSMRGNRDSHWWRNEFRELQKRVNGHEDGTVEDEVFEVLKYSFDQLKKNDKSNEFNMKQLCFLYCSLYPEDFHIERDELVENFISGQLLDESRSWREQADQGHSILDDLVDVCLLETCADLFGKESVKMHDLVRGMALRICKEKYLVKAGEKSLEEIPKKEEWTKDLEKVSFMSSGIKRIGEGFSPDCPKLSTMLLQQNYWLKVIPESFFYKMKGLCTLDMGGNLGIAMLPDSISDLKNLKSLHLWNCNKLEKVPYLGKMKALRELNLSKTAIKESPQGLEELVKLRFLSMNADGLKRLPSGVFLKLGHLEHLIIPLDIQVSTEEIKNLKLLVEFHGGVKSISDFNMFVKSRAPGRCYRLRLSRWYEGSPVNNGAAILEMDDLVLHDCNLIDEKLLMKCEGVSKWFVDGLSEGSDNPTSLKKLEITECRGIEWIMRSEDGQLLSSLEEIELKELDDLKGVVGVMERERGGLRVGAAAAQPPVFSSLKRLVIYKCTRMKKLGLPVSSLPNLEELKITHCEEVEDIFEKEKEDEGRDAATTLLPKLRELKLFHLPKLRKVGLPAASGVPNLELIWIRSCKEVEEIFEDEGIEVEEIFEDEGIAAASILPKLRELWLKDLERVKRVSKATIISNSIQKIWITGCPKLKNRLPLGFDDQAAPPPSLKLIGVKRGWWESLEWDNPLLPQRLNPFLRFAVE